MITSLPTFVFNLNYLNQAIKFWKVNYLADDTNLFTLVNHFIKLNKHVNLDLKNLAYWLNAKKISVNVKKTELVIFKHQRKK